MSLSLSVMTFNLLEDQEEGSPNSWDKRKEICISVITRYSPMMILCTQQGCNQFGNSRKGSKDTSDQYCIIFYDKEKVELLEGGTFWLSESPSVPGSMSWGSIVPALQHGLFQLKGVESPGFSSQIVNTCLDECSPRVRKNLSLIHTYHGFKGDKLRALEFLKLIFRALWLCWDRETQDLHIDWMLFRRRSLIPVSCEVVSDNIDELYPSSRYPIVSEFMLPLTVRLTDAPNRDGS